MGTITSLRIRMTLLAGGWRTATCAVVFRVVEPDASFPASPHEVPGAAQAYILDYIERFHNPRRRCQMEMLDGKDLLLAEPSVATG